MMSSVVYLVMALFGWFLFVIWGKEMDRINNTNALQGAWLVLLFNRLSLSRKKVQKGSPLQREILLKQKIFDRWVKFRMLKQKENAHKHTLMLKENAQHTLMTHSFTGPIVSFNPRIPRSSRSYMFVLMCFTVGLSHLFMEQQGLDWKQTSIRVGPIVAILSLLMNLVVDFLATHEKREFAWKAHIIFKSLDPDKEYFLEELELLHRQCDYFIKYQTLIQLKRYHDIIAPALQGMRNELHRLLWFLPRTDKDRGLQRIYGGKLDLLDKYETAKMRLDAIEKQYGLGEKSKLRYSWDVVLFLIVIMALVMIVTTDPYFLIPVQEIAGIYILALLQEFLIIFLVNFSGDFLWEHQLQYLLPQTEDRPYSWDSRLSNVTIARKQSFKYLKQIGGITGPTLDTSSSRVSVRRPKRTTRKSITWNQFRNRASIESTHTIQTTATHQMARAYASFGTNKIPQQNPYTTDEDEFLDDEIFGDLEEEFISASDLHTQKQRKPTDLVSRVKPRASSSFISIVTDDPPSSPLPRDAPAESALESEFADSFTDLESHFNPEDYFTGNANDDDEYDEDEQFDDYKPDDQNYV